MAAHDLAADRLLDVGQVEGAGLRGQLGVQNDLEVEVAELARQLGRGAPVESVVDLVRLLEQMLLERGVRLLAVPRAAVGLAQPVGYPGQCPGTGQGALGRHGAEV